MFWSGVGYSPVNSWSSHHRQDNFHWNPYHNPKTDYHYDTPPTPFGFPPYPDHHSSQEFYSHQSASSSLPKSERKLSIGGDSDYLQNENSSSSKSLSSSSIMSQQQQHQQQQLQPQQQYQQQHQQLVNQGSRRVSTPGNTLVAPTSAGSKRRVVFVDPDDANAPWWWPALVVPPAEFETFRKYVGNEITEPKDGEYLVCYFEDGSFSVIPESDAVPFSPLIPPYTLYVAGADGQDFKSDNAVKLATQYWETGIPPPSFVWLSAQIAADNLAMSNGTAKKQIDKGGPVNIKKNAATPGTAAKEGKKRGGNGSLSGSETGGPPSKKHKRDNGAVLGAPGGFQDKVHKKIHKNGGPSSVSPPPNFARPRGRSLTDAMEMDTRNHGSVGSVGFVRPFGSPTFPLNKFEPVAGSPISPARIDASDFNRRASVDVLRSPGSAESLHSIYAVDAACVECGTRLTAENSASALFGGTASSELCVNCSGKGQEYGPGGEERGEGGAKAGAGGFAIPVSIPHVASTPIIPSTPTQPPTAQQSIQHPSTTTHTQRQVPYPTQSQAGVKRWERPEPTLLKDMLPISKKKRWIERYQVQQMAIHKSTIQQSPFAAVSLIVPSSSSAVVEKEAAVKVDVPVPPQQREEEPSKTEPVTDESFKVDPEGDVRMVEPGVDAKVVDEGSAVKVDSEGVTGADGREQPAVEDGGAGETSAAAGGAAGVVATPGSYPTPPVDGQQRQNQGQGQQVVGEQPVPDQVLGREGAVGVGLVGGEEREERKEEIAVVAEDAAKVALSQQPQQQQQQVISDMDGGAAGEQSVDSRERKEETGAVEDKGGEDGEDKS
ncbi:hypothetical protein HDU97_002166 [Phlyctochytrium planicorne]|nr:hypothetical protein HDU97_002166 [Phlyctochytrium planicorne]